MPETFGPSVVTSARLSERKYGQTTCEYGDLPDGWVTSTRPAHPALVSEADFIAAQDIDASRGPLLKPALAVGEEDFLYLAGSVVDQYVTGGGVGPPPSQGGVQHKAQ